MPIFFYQIVNILKRVTFVIDENNLITNSLKGNLAGCHTSYNYIYFKTVMRSSFHPSYVKILKI